MSSGHWMPAASQRAAHLRAELQRQIREFFQQRNVLEVETPLLSHYGVTDVHLHNAKTLLSGDGLRAKDFFLQTSPEYAMKRLLAAGFGSIFQLCKVVRDEEISSRHNPEFTMLEWYRPDWSDRELMKEVEQLLTSLIDVRNVEYLSYQQAFVRFFDADPLTVQGLNKLKRYLSEHGFVDLVEKEDRDTLLQLAMSYFVEPSFEPDTLTFVTNFPATQAALAVVDDENPETAKRFEVFFAGLELANGFQELTDPEEQLARFKADNKQRETIGRKPQPIDDRLLDAMKSGLPDSAGVAIGVDRLLMIKVGTKDIRDVLLFPISNA